MHYQINAVLLPKATAIESFDPAKADEYVKALIPVVEKFNAKAPWTSPVEGTDEVKAAVDFPAGKTSELLSLSGAGIVRELRLQPASLEDSMLRRLLVRIDFDGSDSPAVSCPMGDLFGLTFAGAGLSAEKTFAALPMGWSAEGGYLRYIMPFAKGMRIEIENGAPTEVKVSATLRLQKRSEIPATLGRFHARWRREIPTVKDRNYLINEVQGRGRWLGFALSMQDMYPNPGNAWGFLEGDEMIWVDGEAAPSISGTGTEDFFSGAWYFWNHAADRAFYGVNDNQQNDFFRCGAYRLMVADAIPFQKSIRATIEHSTGNSATLDESGSAFFYCQATAPLTEKDLPGAQRVPFRRGDSGRLG